MWNIACTRIRWKVVSVRALLFLSAATTWCGQAEQEEDPLEGLGHEDKIRDALVCLSAASCLPVGALTFSGLRLKKKNPPTGAKTFSKFCNLFLSTCHFHRLFPIWCLEMENQTDLEADVGLQNLY